MTDPITEIRAQYQQLAQLPSERFYWPTEQIGLLLEEIDHLRAHNGALEERLHDRGGEQ